MKKLFLFIFWGMLALSSKAQSEDTTLVKFYKVNFAVPDIPAFSILGNAPSDILRPTDVKGLSIIATEFYNGSSVVLPKSFSMEIAPFLLAKSNALTLNEYDKKKFLYNLRLSVGTNTNKVNNLEYTNLAVGVRFTLINDGDLKSDKSFRNNLWESTKIEVKSENELKEKFAEHIQKKLNVIVIDSTLNNLMELYISEHKEKQIKQIDNDHNYIEEIESVKEKYKADNWNKEKLEFAYAFLGSSPDSLVKNIKGKQHSLWLTYTNPIKTTWGQLLLGLNYSYISSDSLNTENMNTVYFGYNTFSIASRFYFGSNRIKGFFEGQYKYTSLAKKTNLMFNVGSEISIGN